MQSTCSCINFWWYSNSIACTYNIHVYSGTPQCEHPWNMDTPQIWTLSCVPIVAIMYKTNLIKDTPEIRTVNWCPRSKGVPLYTWYTLKRINCYCTCVWVFSPFLQFCIMPEDKNSPDFIFYAPKTKISDLVSTCRFWPVYAITVCLYTILFKVYMYMWFCFEFR